MVDVHWPDHLCTENGLYFVDGGCSLTWWSVYRKPPVLCEWGGGVIDLWPVHRKWPVLCGWWMYSDLMLCPQKTACTLWMVDIHWPNDLSTKQNQNKQKNNNCTLWMVDVHWPDDLCTENRLYFVDGGCSLTWWSVYRKPPVLCEWGGGVIDLWSVHRKSPVLCG